MWLQVFGKAVAQPEDRPQPLVEVRLEEEGADAPRVQIRLGGHDAIEMCCLTHEIKNVECVLPQIGADGRDVAIEFVDKQGKTSLLIFKH